MTEGACPLNVANIRVDGDKPVYEHRVKRHEHE